LNPVQIPPKKNGTLGPVLEKNKIRFKFWKSDSIPVPVNCHSTPSSKPFSPKLVIKKFRF
jgi:hypothetical protein